MRCLLTLIVLLVCSGLVLAQLSGPLEGNYGPGLLTVTGNISVQAGYSATIMPGTTFEFMGPYSFTIYGLLTAEGTESDSILFTTNVSTNPGRWRALKFHMADDESRLSYAIIEHGYDPVPGPAEGGGGLRIEGGSMVVSHCTIRYNQCAQSGGGACVRLNNSVLMEYCLITNNIGPYGGGIACNGTPTFDHCVIVHNEAGQGGGIGCWDASPTIINCTIAYNDGDDASALRGSNSHPAAWNTIFMGDYNGPAIGLYNGSSMSGIGYCDFFGHPGGLVGGNSIPGIGNLSQANGNGDPCDQYFNILMDPMFVSAGTNDYHLTSASPCMDSGNPASPNDPDGTVADIGALYFDQSQLPPAYGFDGYVTLIDTRPTNRRFSLTHVSGEITWIAFTGFCPGTRGQVVGHAQPEWSVMANGDGNDGDSIIFVTDVPLTEGTVESFVLRFPECNSDLHWCVGDSSGVIPGAGSRQAEKKGNNLYPNVPNPFNPSTTISFEIAQAGHVRISVYNVMGQEVAVLMDQLAGAGEYHLEFYGGEMPSGAYFYHIDAPEFSAVRKMLLVR